ncbi:MAG: hypothetical protein H7Y20_05215 [Bryobacteraceae bacterium]|nr:hypothetical protein [Bryobacteraceae bacterium]
MFFVQWLGRSKLKSNLGIRLTGCGRKVARVAPSKLETCAQIVSGRLLNEEPRNAVFLTGKQAFLSRKLAPQAGEGLFTLRTGALLINVAAMRSAIDQPRRVSGNAFQLLRWLGIRLAWAVIIGGGAGGAVGK